MFFAVLIESRKQDTARRNAMNVDLCDIQAISICNGEYHSDIRENFRARIDGGTRTKGGLVRTSHKDPKAAATLKSIFEHKRKIEGHG